MGLKKCDKRYLENSESNNLMWSKISYGEMEIRGLMGSALKVATILHTHSEASYRTLAGL